MVTTRKRAAPAGAGAGDGAGAGAGRGGRGRGRGRGKRGKAEHGAAGDDAATQGGAAKRAKTASDDDAEARRDEAAAARADEGAVKQEPAAAAPPESEKGKQAHAEGAAVKGEKEEEEQEAAAAAGSSRQGGRVESNESRKSTFPPGQKPQVLERGHVFFFYRPKVMLEAASSIDEVQRFYMVLKPTKGVSVAEGKHRLLIVAKKHLPSSEGPGRKETMWSFVRKVSADESEVMKELEAEDYTTKTRGERHVEPARLAGEGVYGLIMHHGHAHLAYFLTMPLDPGEVQRELNIRREASLIVQVKNPENPERQRNMPTNYPGFQGLGEGHHPTYPEELMVGFENVSSTRHKRFSSNEDLPRFLEIEGTEILLIGADTDVVGELHEPAEEIERIAAKEVREVEKSHDPEAKVLHDLPAIASLHAPMAPATSGTWA